MDGTLLRGRRSYPPMNRWGTVLTGLHWILPPSNRASTKQGYAGGCLGALCSVPNFTANIGSGLIKSRTAMSADPFSNT